MKIIKFIKLAFFSSFALLCAFFGIFFVIKEWLAFFFLTMAMSAFRLFYHLKRGGAFCNGFAYHPGSHYKYHGCGPRSQYRYHNGCGRPQSMCVYRSSTANAKASKVTALDERNQSNDGDEGPTVLYQDHYTQITDHDNVYKFNIDLPGVSASDVTVEVEQGILNIRAERKSGIDKITTSNQRFFVGSCADIEQSEANMSDGVLTITVPKIEDQEETNPISIIPVVASSLPEEDFENDKEVRFSYDLPGVSASNVKLELHEGTLKLYAERQRGSVTSSIGKKFAMSSSKVQTDSIMAYLSDGVLTITALRKPKKTVSVTSGNLQAEIPDEKDEVGNTDKSKDEVVAPADEDGEKVDNNKDGEDEEDEEFIAL